MFLNLHDIAIIDSLMPTDGGCLSGLTSIAPYLPPSRTRHLKLLRMHCTDGARISPYEHIFSGGAVGMHRPRLLSFAVITTL